MHMIAGNCKDANVATKDGKITVRGVPCACVPCTQLRFDDCEMMALMACKPKSAKTPRSACETSSLRTMDSLSAWAASLKSKQLVALRAAASERSMEGLYWLAVLSGKPFEATEQTLHATDTIEPGYLVVKASWLKLNDASCEGGFRSYTLLDAEVLLVVNHMEVRIAGLQFSAGKGGPANRTLRGMPKEAGAKLLYIVSKDTHHAIMGSCDDAA